MTMKQLFLLISAGLVLSIAFPVNLDKTFVKIPDKKSPTPVKSDYSAKYNSTFYCAICEFLINQGEEFITKTTNENDAVHFMEHICLRLPKSKHHDCDDFVRENKDKLIEFIVEKESAHSVCTELHFCAKYDHYLTECDFCKYAFHRTERFLSHNNTLTSIIDFGNTFCINYPKRYSQLCNDFIPYYYTHLVARVIDQYDFVSACNNLGLCT